MPMNGAYTLADVAARASMLDVACRGCDRRGRLNVARLIEAHGQDAPLPDLKAALAGNCPKRQRQRRLNGKMHFAFGICHARLSSGPWRRIQRSGASQSHSPCVFVEAMRLQHIEIRFAHGLGRAGDLEREIEHRLLAFRDVGLSVVDCHLVRDRRGLTRIR